MAESVTHSRPTSVSRVSRSGSTRSRSLIKKNIETQDLGAADLLIERFTAWKIIVKQLAAYFEGVAEIENATAREMTKIAGFIQVPFRSGNQFLGEGGLQDVFYGIRDKTRQIADQHADLGRTVNSSIVQHLQKLLVEVKAHLKNVQNDTAKLAHSVASQRETSTKLIGELANDISVFRNTPMAVTAKGDPYLANLAVAQQLNKQVLEENLLQKSIIVMQQNSAHFETGIVRAIQSAWQTFDEWQSRATTSNQDIYRSLSAHMASLSPDQEWISFAARSDHLVDPETPLRDPSMVNYPCKDDMSVRPVHTGHLERKKRYSRSYQENYFVLTAAGYLHAFSQSDPSHPSGHGLNPVFSLFLPNCTLGPPSSPSSKAHKFHIEGRKDGTGTTKSGSLRGLLGGDNTLAWSFKARSREEMMEWWNDLKMLCARYLIASEQIERSGPVEHAVRSAGYEDVSGDEGSSLEEEADEMAYRDTTVVDPGVNGYAYDKGGIGYETVEVGPHGYVKKGDPAYDTYGIHAHPSQGNISSRQQDKAPAFPHTMYDPATAAAGQDTLAPQVTGGSRTVEGSGYVPDDLAIANANGSRHHHPYAIATTVATPPPQHLGSPRGSVGRLSPLPGHMPGAGSPHQRVGENGGGYGHGYGSPHPVGVSERYSPRGGSPRGGSPMYGGHTGGGGVGEGQGHSYRPTDDEERMEHQQPVTASFTGDNENGEGLYER